jgi:putative endonuclease
LDKLKRAKSLFLGRYGEEEAVRFLKRHGYRVADRNVRCRFGEVDVVAWDGVTLCFIEIKARRGTGFGFPEEAVMDSKRWRLGRLAHWYMQSRGIPDGTPIRFDVVSILFLSDGSLGRIRLLKGALEFDVV